MSRWPLIAPTAAYSLSWSPRIKTLLVGGGDGVISQWRWMEPSMDGTRFGWRSAHDAEVCGIAWMPDDQHFVTASRDGSVAMWKAGAIPMDSERTVVTGRGKITGMAYSADGKSVVTSNEGQQVSIVYLEAGKAQAVLQGAYRSELSALRLECHAFGGGDAIEPRGNLGYVKRPAAWQSRLAARRTGQRSDGSSRRASGSGRHGSSGRKGNCGLSRCGRATLVAG